MKLETIKKEKKKHIIIGSMIVLSVVGCLTLTTSRAKYRNIQNIKLANGVVDYKVSDLKLAIKVSEDGTTYKNSSTIPEGNYTLNAEKSKCRIPTSTLVGEEAPQAEGVTIEYIDGKINVLGVTKKDTRCYVYFDKVKTAKDTIAKLNVQNIKEEIPNFTVAAKGTETVANNGIYITEDSMYGKNAKSYYWRGAATTNHVIFDSKCWRIVRINGDGSIRLIYNGTPTDNTCSGNGANANSVVLKGTAYNSTYNNSKYVGWTYASSDIQRPSDTNPQTDGTAAPIKITLESWYSSNISVVAKEKLVLGKFCNDRHTQNNETWRATGAAQYYAAYSRLIENRAPTLSCPTGDIYELSVGMITADEVTFAGANAGNTNTFYYLFNGQYYWTMSPYSWNNRGHAAIFRVYTDGSLSNDYVDDNIGLGIRPVINLRSDVTFNLGSDGTQNNPYIVEV